MAVEVQRIAGAAEPQPSSDGQLGAVRRVSKVRRTRVGISVALGGIGLILRGKLSTALGVLSLGYDAAWLLAGDNDDEQ